MKEVALLLHRVVERAEIALLELTDEEASVSHAPGKWSPKQIVGHLIDSAANNHARFIKAQLREDLVFDGYRQEDWVRLQGYQSAVWVDLVSLWKMYNLHLSFVIERIPKEIAHRKIRRHNLHRIAWQTVSEDESTTLAYFIQDYIGHLRHHLDQILSSR